MCKQWITVTMMVFAILAVSSTAQAASWDFDANPDDNWDGAAAGFTNWVGDAAPASAEFDLAVGTQATMNVNDSLTGVTFQRGAVFNIVAGGGTLTISNIAGIDTADAFAYGIAAPVTLGVDQEWDIFAGSTLTVSGNIGGAFAITKDLTGTLVLSGTNTYNGGTIINVGTVSIADVDDLGAVASGVTFGAGGTGVLTNTASVTLTDQITLTGNGTMDVDPTFVQSLTGLVTGAGTLIKTDTGTLRLFNGANNYTGGTTLTGGGILLDHVGALGPNAVAAAAGTTLGANQNIGMVANNIGIGGGALTINGGGDMGFSGVISGAGGLTINTTAGTETITLWNTSNSYAGATTITQGTLQLSNSGVITNTSAVTVAAGGTLDLSGNSEVIGSLAGAGTVNLVGGTLTAGGDNTATAFTGTITGTGGLTKDGNQAMTISGVNIGYTGATTLTNVAGNILRLGSANVLSDVSVVNIGANAVFDLDDNDETIGGLSGAGTVTLGAVAGNTLTIGGGNGIDTFSGGITETASIVKTGTGIQIFSGNSTNTYTGTTTINGGILRASSGDAIPNASAVTVGAMGTFDLANLNEDVASLAGTGNVTLGTGSLGLLGGNSTFAGLISDDVGNNGEIDRGPGGVLTLNTANQYGVAGAIGTTLSGGGILLGNADGIGAGDVAVTVNSTLGASSVLGANVDNNVIITDGVTLTLDGTESINFSGNFTDVGGANTGAVTIAAGAITDIFTFSGTNSYGGATTITTGTLIASGGAAIDDASAVNLGGGATARFEITSNETIGSLAGIALSTVDLNSSTLTAGGNTAFAGVIMDDGAGGGALTKTGAGTLTLSGANTYGGMTTILGGGTISISAINNLGVATTGGITFGAGGGTLDVSANSFTLGDAVTLTGNGTINNAVGLNTTLGGIIGGAGALVKTGAGTLTLTGINTYGGGTTVTTGTLAGEGGLVGLAPIQGNIINNATVNFIQAANGDYDGVMTGNGLINKTGAAQLTISNVGSGAFAGTATVTTGTLHLTGTLGAAGGTGAMTVAPAGTLTGTGTYGGNLVVNAAGNVTPGDPAVAAGIGTLTIGGNYTPNAAAILNVQASATPFAAPLGDILLLPTAAATATLNNSVINATLTENVNNYPTGVTTYSVVQTTGGGGAAVVGTFAASGAGSTLPVDSAIFQYTLAYTATTADFVITRQAIQNLALTPNQTAVGTALQARIYDAGDMQNVATVINAYPQAAQVRTALNQISPASLDVSTGATFDGARMFSAGLADHLRGYHIPGAGNAGTTVKADDDDTPLLAFGGNNDDVLALMMEAREQKRADRAEISEGPLKFWVRQFNTWSDEDRENDIPGYDNFTTGVAIGGDIAIGDNLAVGASIGYSNTDIELTGGFGDAEIDSLRGAIYATWDDNNGLYADAILGVGGNWYDNTRNINFMGRRATSDHTGVEYSAYLGGGYDFLFFGGYVGPTVSIQYTGLSEESYNESGAGALNQNIDSRDSHSLQTAVGLRYLHPFKLPGDTTLVPEVRAKWLHEFMNDRDVSARFTGGGAAYTVDGNEVEENSVLLGGRLSAYLNESISLYADYELQLQGSGGQTGHTVSGGLRIAW